MQTVGSPDPVAHCALLSVSRFRYESLSSPHSVTHSVPLSLDIHCRSPDAVAHQTVLPVDSCGPCRSPDVVTHEALLFARSDPSDSVSPHAVAHWPLPSLVAVPPVPSHHTRLRTCRSFALVAVPAVPSHHTRLRTGFPSRPSSVLPAPLTTRGCASSSPPRRSRPGPVHHTRLRTGLSLRLVPAPTSLVTTLGCAPAAPLLVPSAPVHHTRLRTRLSSRSLPSCPSRLTTRGCALDLSSPVAARPVVLASPHAVAHAVLLRTRRRPCRPDSPDAVAHRLLLRTRPTVGVALSHHTRLRTVRSFPAHSLSSLTDYQTRLRTGYSCHAFGRENSTVHRTRSLTVAPFRGRSRN
jgi:hypothetical protein